MGMYYLVQSIGLGMKWLCIYGRSALFLNVVHLLIIPVLLLRFMGIEVDNLLQYALTNVVLLAILLLLPQAVAWCKNWLSNRLFFLKMEQNGP